MTKKWIPSYKPVGLFPTFFKPPAGKGRFRRPTILIWQHNYHGSGPVANTSPADVEMNRLSCRLEWLSINFV